MPRLLLAVAESVAVRSLVSLRDDEAPDALLLRNRYTGSGKTFVPNSWPSVRDWWVSGLDDTSRCDFQQHANTDDAGYLL